MLLKKWPVFLLVGHLMWGNHVTGEYVKSSDFIGGS